MRSPNLYIPVNKRKGFDHKSYGRAQTLTPTSVSYEVKKQLAKVNETKSYISTATVRSCTDDFTYYQNLLAPITEGTGAENRLGEKITGKSIKINWRAYCYNTPTLTETKILRLIVFSAKDQFGTSTGTLSQSNLFRTPVTSASASGFIDLHKVNVLYDRKITVDPQASGINQNRVGTITVPIKKTLTYVDDASPVYLKTNQYYFAFGYYSQGGILSYIDFRYQFTVNFQDS